MRPTITAATASSGHVVEVKYVTDSGRDAPIAPSFGPAELVASDAFNCEQATKPTAIYNCARGKAAFPGTMIA